ARHRLDDRIKANAGPVGAIRAEGRNARQDDVGFDCPERLVIESEFFKDVHRQVSEHDISARNQTALDLAALRMCRIERDALLVAVYADEHGAFALFCDWRYITVFATFASIYPDDLGTEISEQHPTIWTGDVATKVENSDAC